MKIPKDILGLVLSNFRDFLVLICKALRNIGEREFLDISKGIYLLPDSDLVEKAKEILERDFDFSEDKNLSAEEFAERLKKEFDSYGLD